MPNEVIAELEIDGKKLLHFSEVFLRQRFNQHHDFSISINHDALETLGSFSLKNTKDLIGKPVVIRFLQVSANTRQAAQEFLGVICEIGMVQSHSAAGDLLIKGYSPTILLEDGPRMASFSMEDDKTLKDIVSDIIKPGLSKTNAASHIEPRYTSPVKYVCQYKESTFHFINRLSSDYGENFYYDGKTLIFGEPSDIELVPVIYGEDLSDMQLNLHVEPIEVVKYAYDSMENKVFISDRNSINDSNSLDEYSKLTVDVSNKLYSQPDALPLTKIANAKSEVTSFVDRGKEAIAAGLVVLTGTTTNPSIFLGCVADVKISKREGASFKQEDFGVYLVTSITHHVTGQGKYYNTFEGLSGWVKGVPVYNAGKPVAEPQFGKVVDNKDPLHLHRVRVQLEWQLKDEKTPWIWILTPDAGSGKDGAGGAGFVFNPQVGDRVLVGFEYNNPDMPFIMGSIFHGKSGKAPPPTPGGLVPRCITGRDTSASVCIVDNAVHIIDGGGHSVKLLGDGKILVEASTDIQLKVGDSYIHIEPSKISIKTTTLAVIADDVNIQGKTSAILQKDASTYFKAEGSQVTMTASTTLVQGDNTQLTGNTKATLGGTQVEVNGTGSTVIKGTTVQIN